jgi:hypothetical protein
MKTLIKKADGSAVKSKLHAVKFLENLGIDKSELIEENGQFYYESGAETPVEALTLKEEKTEPTALMPVTWETEVYDKNNERTKLFIPGTEIIATILCKHPAGQGRNKSSFEINIGDENFIMSVDLLSKIFKVRG